MRPPMVTYRLSNRQQKELLVRGQRLSIAIPVDYEEYADPLEFARLAMPEHAEHIVSAEHEEILCGRALVGSSGMTGLMGVIGGEHDTNLIYAWISVVVVTLEHGRVRGELQMQWPGIAFFPNGAELR